MNVDPESVFTLFIESGLHAGTVQRLAPGIYTIGSELDADIILSDQEIAAIHVIVELDRHGLRLEPLQGVIAIDGESVKLEPGGERHLSLPATFSLGDASIKITAPKDAVQSRRRMRNAVIVAGLAVLAIVGFQILNPLSVDPSDLQASSSMQRLAPDIDQGTASDTRAVMTGDADVTEEVEAGDGEARDEVLVGDDDVAMAVPDITLDQAAAALRERLATDDFPDIEVKTAVDRILVRGEAEPERMSEWRDIRIWFDGAFGRDFLLVAEVEPAEKDMPPDLAIEAVWSGEDPYLIAGGQRFAVGAHVGDGWMIDRIGTDEITFKRGDRSFSLTL